MTIYSELYNICRLNIYENIKMKDKIGRQNYSYNVLTFK